MVSVNYFDIQSLLGVVFAGVHIIAAAFLYFLIGTRLNLFGNHWLNYLSVSGSLVVALFSLIGETPYLSLVLNTSFAGLTSLLDREIVDYQVVSIMLTPLPSITTWFGMLYKSIKTI